MTERPIETFFQNFGLQLKFGAYADYGAHKEVLQDLLMFYSSSEKKLVSIKGICVPYERRTRIHLLCMR